MNGFLPPCGYTSINLDNRVQCCVLCVDNTKCLAAQMKEQRGDADTVQTHVTEQGNPEREPNGGLCDLLLTEFGQCL